MGPTGTGKSSVRSLSLIRLKRLDRLQSSSLVLLANLAELLGMGYGPAQPTSQLSAQFILLMVILLSSSTPLDLMAHPSPTWKSWP
jgi:hypothetical protein